MKAAFYSRNNSYSRSYNASQAENEGRYPRTRAAKELGLSIKSFDAGCKAISYNVSEWHHVGKYANRVDYYDTNELAENPLFWRGAINSRNTDYCKERISQTIQQRLNSRMVAYIVPQAKVGNCISDEYVASLSVDSSHNLWKVIREIARNRAKQRKHANVYESKHIPKKWRKFWLHRDGTIELNNATARFSDIDWNNYEASHVCANGAVLFKHVNFLS